MPRAFSLSTALPGWYADPGDPRSLRYWDGLTWTSYARPAFHGPAVDPPLERRWGQRAVTGFWLEGGCRALVALATPFVVHALFEQRDSSSPFETTSSGQTLLVLFLLGLQLVAIASFGGTVLVAVWSNHATHTARFLGLRTKHSPGWAVAAWLVPVVSLWFPYQVVRDLLPLGHPARSKLGLWWAMHICSSLVFLRLSFGDDSSTAVMVAVVLGVITAACSLASAALGHQLATAVGKEHERALNHLAAIVGGRPL